MRARICVNVPSIAVTSSSRWPDPRAMRRRRDAVCAQQNQDTDVHTCCVLHNAKVTCGAALLGSECHSSNASTQSR